MNIQAPRGTKDILPSESHRWREVERTVSEVASLFCYDEIRTPMFESAKLFKRSVGEETDIVSKEMYLFVDKGGEEFALRPELTAPVVRAVIENSIIAGQAPCARLYYNSAPGFRYEKPQLGRQRQFHQFGTELLGPSGAQADAETIHFAISIFERLGLSGYFKLRINTLGSPDARAVWRELLVEHLRKHFSSLTEESRKRTETNPMRVLDSKAAQDHEIVRSGPLLFDYLSFEDLQHFDGLQSMLKAIGISFEVDPYLVRGLDYYTRTVFELTSSALGSQDALCGGGRYDNLIEQLGGHPTPAVGFGAGVERTLIALEHVRREGGSKPKPEIYLIAQSELAREKVFEIASDLRGRGIRAMYDLNTRSMKAQMRDANREEVRFVLIIGESELASGSGLLKQMSTGEQRTVQFGRILEEIGKFE